MNLLKFRICTPSPLKNNKKQTLENGRTMIPNRLGRLFYSGNLDVGKFLIILFLSRETLRFEKNNCSRSIPDHPRHTIYLEMILGSFHGFGKASVLSLYLRYKC